MKIIGKSIIFLILTIIFTGCQAFSLAPVTGPTEIHETSMSTIGTTVAETQTAIPTAARTAMQLPSPLPFPPTQIPSFTFADDIVGVWTGEAQWLCANGDPSWATTIEFKSDGNFTATMVLPDLSETAAGNGKWSLSESNIEIKFSTTIWSGRVSPNKMEGSIKDESFPACEGKWSLAKP